MKKIWVPFLILLLLPASYSVQRPAERLENAHPPHEDSIRSQTEEPGETILYFPDYVDGGGWSVQLALSNVDADTSAEAVVEVYDQDGGTILDLLDSGFRFEIPPLGSRVLKSSGTGEIRRGWIQVRTGTAPVSGLLTYKQGTTGIEVSVEPAELGDRFALFVEESGDVGAGLAVFKPEAAPSIQLRVRDEEGSDPLEEAFGSRGNFHQLALTLPEWFDAEGIDRGFLSDFRGLLFLRSEDESRFAPLGLRFGKRNRSLSSVPAIGDPAQVPLVTTQYPLETALYFPDYVDGSGWSVQSALSNVDAETAAEVSVEVFDQGGQPIRDLFDFESAFEIPALGSRVLRSAGAGAIRRGWIKIESDPASVSGLLTYRQADTGVEVSVKPVELGSQFALFVEESSVVGAGVAIFKPDASPNLELRIRDEEGKDPLDGVFIPRRDFHQLALTLPEWLGVEGVDTGFLRDLRGLPFLRTEDDSRFAPLGLRFGKGSHSLSSVPAIRIMDGGGIDGGQAPAPTVTLSVTPSSIPWGESATLTWSSTNAESAEITPDVGAFPTSGSRKVSPRTTTTYRITVRGADGQTQTATATVRVVISEQAALRALYETTGGPDWTNRGNWRTGRPLGEWHGVGVDGQGRVTGLILTGNGRAGAFPPELGGLANLEVLWLQDNELTGAVPAEFGGLENLRSVVLARNGGMSGALPARLADLRRLEELLAADTSLCAPSDTGFRDWLSGVRKRRVVTCGADDPPAVALTQAVQSREFPVLLVAGEEALLRVFVTSGRESGADLPPVRATFYREGEKTQVVEIPGKPVPIPREIREVDPTGSANAQIPGRVAQPGLEMVIDVDPEGTLGPDPGVTKRIPESGRLGVEVRTMPVFDLTVIPLLWSRNPDSSIVEVAEGMAQDPGGHSMLKDTRALPPINEIEVKAHAPVLSSTNDAYALLAETELIHATEGASGYYVGMMAGEVAGGAAGLAKRPGPISFSSVRPSTLAHELGHNLNLYHAPCGNPSSLDPSFPGKDGSIGAWGYDFSEPGRLLPPVWPDLMSYCRSRPRWIGEYNFTTRAPLPLAHGRQRRGVFAGCRAGEEPPAVGRRRLRRDSVPGTGVRRGCSGGASAVHGGVRDHWAGC